MNVETLYDIIKELRDEIEGLKIEINLIQNQLRNLESDIDKIKYGY